MSGKRKADIKRYVNLDYDMPRTKGDCKRQEKPINQGNTANTRSFKDMIKILFVCHGSILKSPEEANKINRFLN